MTVNPEIELLLSQKRDMANAVARSAFFERYEFEIDPGATLYKEFCRLARFRHWKQGSNSQIFEKAWIRCFGSDVPVGVNVDRRQAQVEEDDGFTTMLDRLQRLDIQEGLTKKERKAQPFIKKKRMK